MLLPRLPKISHAVALAALISGACMERTQAAALLPLQGLTISLSSSHQTVALPPVEKTPARTADAIAVLATLRNRGPRPVEVAFEDIETARGKFVFSLYREEDDELLWTSLGEAPARVAARVSGTSLRLARKTAWSSAVRVPLQFEGEWLAAGRYRIEAVLAGNPSVFAALGFEVIRNERPVVNSGIEGRVLMTSTTSTRSTVPAPEAALTIRRLAAAVQPNTAVVPETQDIVFTGKTDREGRFNVALPPGNYFISAVWGRDIAHLDTQPGSGAIASSGIGMNGDAPVSSQSATTFLHTGSAKVTVKAGAMSSVTIHLRGRPGVADPRPPVLNQTLVLSTDSAAAERFTAANGTAKIRVQASGTVPHPGYRNARLVVSPVIPMIAPADGGGLMVLNFVVDPPDPNFFYPMVIATVEATVELPDNGETVIWIQSQGERATLTLPVAGAQ